MAITAQGAKQSIVNAGSNLGKGIKATWHSGGVGKAALIGTTVLAAHYAHSAWKGHHERALEARRQQELQQQGPGVA